MVPVDYRGHMPSGDAKDVEIARLTAELDAALRKKWQVQRWLPRYKCHFTGGDFMESGGRHCPIGDPCYRCRTEDAEEALDVAIRERDEARRALCEQVVLSGRTADGQSTRVGWSAEDEATARGWAYLNQKEDPDPALQNRGQVAVNRVRAGRSVKIKERK
jgi:hypothetical protein